MEIWGGGYYTILDKYTDTGLLRKLLFYNHHQIINLVRCLAQKLEPTNISPRKLFYSALPLTELSKL